jgi:chromosome partitioning protein
MTPSEDTSSESEIAYGQAVAHHHAGRLAEAEPLYRAVLDSDPGHTDAAHGLGVLMLQRHQIDPAIGLLGRAICSAPDHAAYHNHMGVAMRARRRAKHAALCYKRALWIESDHAEARYNLGVELQLVGKRELAVGHFQRALLLRPDYPEALEALQRAVGRKVLPPPGRARPRPMAAPAATSTATAGRGLVYVLGNEKGGSGKSTIAMHLIVALLRSGFSVGSIDLDNRQWTLSRYVTNREAFAREHDPRLPLPTHQAIARSDADSRAAAEIDERDRFEAALALLRRENDCVVIDCPGTDSFLGRLGHSYADTLITPMNDSFIDLDLLARVDPDTLEVKRPSIYSEMVWECRKKRAERGQAPIDWIVTRNRLSSVDARNKRDMAGILEKLSRRIGFRLVAGFGERVIYRELFLKGLTMLDLRETAAGLGIKLSHVAARQEVRALISALRLPGTPASARPPQGPGPGAGRAALRSASRPSP